MPKPKRPTGPKRQRQGKRTVYRSATGRFISRAEFEALRALFADAKANRGLRSKLTPGHGKAGKFKPANVKNASGKRVKGLRASSLGNTVPTRKKTKAGKARFEKQRTALDAGKVPGFDATYDLRDENDPKRSIRVTYWRFEGLESEPLVKRLITRLQRDYEEKGLPILTRVAVYKGKGKQGDSVGSQWRKPSDTKTWLDQWQDRPSAQQMLQSAAKHNQTLWFEVEAQTRGSGIVRGNNGAQETSRRAKPAGTKGDTGSKRPAAKRKDAGRKGSAETRPNRQKRTGKLGNLRRKRR